MTLRITNNQATDNLIAQTFRVNYPEAAKMAIIIETMPDFSPATILTKAFKRFPTACPFENVIVAKGILTRTCCFTLEAKQRILDEIKKSSPIDLNAFEKILNAAQAGDEATVAMHLLPELFKTETAPAAASAHMAKRIGDDFKAFAVKKVREHMVFTCLQGTISLTDDTCNLDALKQYIATHHTLPPQEIAENFKTTFFTEEGITAFLAARNIEKTLPKLSTLNIKYTAYGSVVKNHLTELSLLIPPMMTIYTADAYFEKLRLIETTFSQKEMDIIKELSITKKQALLKALYDPIQGAKEAKALLKTL